MMVPIVVLTGLLVSCVCTVVSQTCTAGFTGDNALDPFTSGGIYVNNAQSHRAQCDGTVYAWHYCYYPVNEENGLQAALGVYGYNSESDQFFLRPKSYYSLYLGSREDSFTCGNITLNPSQYFQTFEGDRVGACLRNNGSQFLNILAEDNPNNLRVAKWGGGSGSCGENNMSQSPEGYEEQSRITLHLYVEINIDECALGDDDCHDTLANCTDLVGGSGSFECTCITGYTGDGVTCTNVDECSISSGLCHQQASCMDTDGSFTCTCNSGYTGDGQNCSDIDECAMDTDTCDQQASCMNADGSYTCLCHSGYTGNGQECNDIDECAAGTDMCHEEAFCVNNNGSYTCTCNRGYTGDGQNCIDINECAADKDVCHEWAFCVNTDGSYTCTCNSGFTGNGQVCEDIDECAIDTDICHYQASCMNTDGRYTCTCDTGYSGNGLECNGE